MYEFYFKQKVTARKKCIAKKKNEKTHKLI